MSDMDKAELERKVQEHIEEKKDVYAHMGKV